jgi:hypothetical protein
MSRSNLARGGRCAATPTDNGMCGSAPPSKSDFSTRLAVSERLFHSQHCSGAAAGVISPLVGKHFANAHDLLRRLFFSLSRWPFSSLPRLRRCRWRARKCARIYTKMHALSQASSSHPRSLSLTLLHPIEANLKQTRARGRRRSAIPSGRSISLSRSHTSSRHPPRLISLSQSWCMREACLDHFQKRQ